jgi:hypothetical protein
VTHRLTKEQRRDATVRLRGPHGCSYSLGGTFTDTTSGARVTTAKLAAHTGNIFAS